MRKILEKLAAPGAASVAVTLDHAARQKSRGLLKLDDGSEAALLLERGTSLEHGDRLLADDGVVVLVQAALEALSVVTARDPLELCRAAYHLGNRHIAVQIGALRLAYLHDHVLDDMVRQLGFQVNFAAEAFVPESGAYGHGHAHLSQPPARARRREHDNGQDEDPALEHDPAHAGHDHDHRHDRVHDHHHEHEHGHALEGQARGSLHTRAHSSQVFGPDE